MKIYCLYEYAEECADVLEGHWENLLRVLFWIKQLQGAVKPPKAIAFKGALLSLKCNYRRLLRNSFVQI